MKQVKLKSKVVLNILLNGAIFFINYNTYHLYSSIVILGSCQINACPRRVTKLEPIYTINTSPFGKSESFKNIRMKNSKSPEKIAFKKAKHL